MQMDDWQDAPEAGYESQEGTMFDHGQYYQRVQSANVEEDVRLVVVGLHVDHGDVREARLVGLDAALEQALHRVEPVAAEVGDFGGRSLPRIEIADR